MRHTVLSYLILYMKLAQTSGITCVDVQEKGSGSAFKVEELITLSSLSPDDIRGCVGLLGKERLSSNQSYAVWTSLIVVCPTWHQWNQRHEQWTTKQLFCFFLRHNISNKNLILQESLVSCFHPDYPRPDYKQANVDSALSDSDLISLIKVYGSADGIPEDQLQQLGWIISGIPPSHITNLSLTDVRTIATFGKCTQLTEDQLQKLKDSITEQWLGKQLDDFTSYDLSSLRQILCAFNSTSIQVIHPDAYKDAAPELATLSNCSPDILKELALLATEERAFGDPQTWTSVETGSIGCVMAGLPSIAAIPAEAFEGVTADIINCLPVSAFQAMTSMQISRLSRSAANALHHRRVTLGGDKQYALQTALTNEADSKRSAASPSHFQDAITAALSLLLSFSWRA